MDAMTETSSRTCRCLVGALGVLVLCLWPTAPLVAQAEPPTWTVSDRPLLRIGTVTGPEEYLFETIGGIVALPDGRLAVADAGHLTVRVYDADGRYLYRMGGRGEGPSEFVSIYGLWLTDEGELAVWDDQARRISRFRQTGVHVETTRIIHDDDLMGNLQVFYGPMSGGEVLLAALTTRSTRPGELSADPYLLLRYDRSGPLRAPVGQVEGMWRYRSGPRESATLPFSPVPWVVTSNDTIYVAAGYVPGIEVRDRHGNWVRTLTVPGRREASSSDWAAFQRALRERADELPVGPFLVNLLNREPTHFDDRVPAVAGLLVDDAGLIWAKAFRPSEDSRWLRAGVRDPAPGGAWWVIDPGRGVTVARVELPPSVVPLVIREGDIIGKDVDPLGVERVVIHELRRRGSSR